MNHLSHNAGQSLLSRFRQPPEEFGPIPFWWWQGEPLDRERLRWQLDQLQAKGIRGVNLNYQHDSEMRTIPGDPPLFSESWWGLWDWLVAECAERGMTVGMDDYTLAWPDTGPVGTAMMEDCPGLRGARLEFAEQACDPGKPLSVDLPEGCEFVHAAAYPSEGGELDRNGEVDLNGEWQSNRLTWCPSHGKWHAAVVYARRGGIDPFHPLCGAKTIEHYYRKFEQRSGAALGKTVNYFFQDELTFVPGGMPYWNESFEVAFLDRYGYSFRDASPALWLDLGPRTPKIRMDYYALAADLMERHYFRPIFEWHDVRGMTLGCDQMSRGDPVLGTRTYADYFRTVRWFGAPGADDPGAGDRRNLIAGKVHASIAHLYRRPRVWLEAYHSSGWGITPERLVAFTNENFTFGYNLLSLHGLYYTTYGGWWEWAPPDFHFRQPYWEHMGEFNRYVKRMSMLLTEGFHRCDIAVMYPTSSVQAGLFGQQEENHFRDLAQNLFAEGMDFIFIDDESLCTGEKRDGLLHAAGAAYQVVVLPWMRSVRHETLSALLEFHRCGGTVVILGPLPDATDRVGRNDPYLGNVWREWFACSEAEMRENAFHCSQNGGTAVWNPGKEPQRWLEQIKNVLKRDFAADPGQIAVHHRDYGDLQGYLLYNMRNAPVETTIRVRCRGAVTCWNAWTGEREAVRLAEADRDGSCFRVYFAAREAKWLMIGSEEGQADETTDGIERVEENAIVLGGPWSFEVRPLLDNRWGDYRLPAADHVVGPECRQFQYQPEGQTESASWFAPDFDDRPWEICTYSFGPQFRRYGPFSPDLPEAERRELERALLKLDDKGRRDERIRERWGVTGTAYSFSWKWGIERDPSLLYWLTGPHGLKQGVPDAFIDLGNRESPEMPGSVWYLWTTVWVDEERHKTLVLDARGLTGVYPRSSEMLPCAAWIDGVRVAESSGEVGVTLSPGRHEILYRFVQSFTDPASIQPDYQLPDGKLRLRAYAVIADQPNRQARETVPMRWEREQGLLVYDPYPDYPSHGRYRFTAPPGMREMIMRTRGVAEVWVNGEPALVTTETLADGTLGHRVIPAGDTAPASKVAVRITFQPGYYGGAAFAHPIAFMCGEGTAELVDWSELGLSTYSGGASYRTAFDWKGKPGTRVWLCWSEAKATAEVLVNGQSAGIRLAPPWKVEIGGCLQPGPNHLEIRVANTLANHYTVDLPSLYVFEGQTRSGLFGPVTLVWRADQEGEVPIVGNSE